MTHLMLPLRGGRIGKSLEKEKAKGKRIHRVRALF